MTRTVRDSAMLMNVISRPDPRDWFGIPYDPTDYAAELEAPMRGKRIAFSPRLGYATRVVDEVETLVAAAAKRFEAMGAHVELVDPPSADVSDIFQKIWWSGAGYLLGDLPEEQKAKLDPGLRHMAEEGVKIDKKTYMAATLARGAYGSQMRVFMEKYDFILTPSVATPAFDVGLLSPLNDDDRAWMQWSPFSFPFNLTQQPAASINCGFTKDGLPVGLQIVGRMFDDMGVLAASAAYEMADPHFDKTPPGF
jgi:aspartyl-tRNA(Asn)/glutamyl-tRNA(Gln) amidotransferase subunit A